jgi:hypothetical protein
MTSTSRRVAFRQRARTPLATAMALSLLATAAGAADEIPELSGIWQFGSCGGGFNLSCMVLEEDAALLTNRAKAYRDAIDEAAQPKYDCAPMSIPHMYTDPYAYRIEQHEDRVVIRYGKDDVVRTVWLEGHGHEEPAANEFFYFGHSTGRYEDGALVVTTDRFTFDPQGLNADFRIPSSTQKRVTERFSRDGENLVLEVATIDTFFLNEPWTFRVTSEPFVGEWDESWQCDLESARHSLKLMAPMYPDDPPIERIDY